jgi:hypothetical protein
MEPLFSLDALWEHQAAENATPEDPALIAVPDTDWLGPDPAPFGTATSSEEYPPATEWPYATALWIRRALVVDGKNGVRLTGRIENACYVYFDGAYIGAINPSNGQRTDVPDWFLIIPAKLATEGTHELALLCLDEIGADSSSTTYVYVEAEYLQPVFPFWPSAPMSETLDWVTDVLISEDGTEDRTKIRVVPRQSMSMSFYIPRPYLRLAANTLYGARNDQWLVPQWQFVQHIGAVAAGSLELTVPSTDTVDFRDQSVILIWESPEKYQIASLDFVADDTTLTLAQITEEFADAYVIPLVAGFASNSPSRTFDGRRASAQIDFVIEDNMEISTAAPTQYLGDDIYFDVGLLDGGKQTESIESDFRLMDNGIGAVSYFSPWLYNRPARVHQMMAEDLADGWALRTWLHRRAGRFRQFWQPSFEADLRVRSTGALTTTLIVDSDDYLRFAEARDHIAVETAAGWLPRHITAAEKIDEDSVQLTLDTSLAINASAIRRVSFLGLKRLDTDRAEIQWIGGNVCKVAVATLEIAP